jgi:hypothetical protein
MLFYQIKGTIAGEDIFFSEAAAIESSAQWHPTGGCNRVRADRLKRRGKVRVSQN